MSDPAGQEVIVVFEDVSLRFDEKVALDGVSFEIRRGETWVILGEAGSGKSVLLKVTMGLVVPDSGRVRALGQEITAMPERDLFQVRSQMGMLFQEGALFDSLTIEDNVAYPLRNQPNRSFSADEINEKVVEALRFVELEDTLTKVPSELSGGMRRRVGIARATVTNPPLAIYDSPTAGLDPITANNIMTFIAKQRDLKRTTTIIVSHRYQDGVLMANCEYDAANGKLVSSPGGMHTERRTVFAVMREGRFVFEGDQAALEASTDPYVSKFGRR